MNVRQLLTTADPRRVTEAYLQIYGENGWERMDSYREFLDRIGKLVPVSTGDHTLVVEALEKGWDVHMVDEEGDRFSLSLTPWEQWLPMEIKADDMDPAEVAAHIYWEMTWHGWPEKREAFRDRLLDEVERINRMLDEEG